MTRRFALRVVLAGGLCVLCGTPILAQATNAGSAEANAKQASAAFRAGYAAANAGDLERARHSFAEVVRLEPKIPEGHAALGSVLLNLGRPQEAAAELKRGLALKPHDADMEMNLALAEVREGQSAEALPLLKGLAAEGNALPPEVEIAYAQALTEAGQRPVALEHLRAAVAAVPESATLHDAMGSLLAQEQQWTAAQTEFARAVELDPKMVAARLHLATVLMRLNQPAEAAATLEAAHAEQPQDVGVLNELALSYTAQGSYDKALSLAEEAMRLAPESVTAAYQAALALQGLGREREAIPLFARVVEADPRNADALTNYALALVQQGHAKEAIPLYTRAVALTPENPVVHEDFGVAYLQQSDIDDAIREFETGLKLDNDSQQLHYNLGLAYKLKDDTAHAIPELEVAARLDPSSPDPAYTLGILYMQAGRFSDAEAQLRHTLELRPQNGDAWAVLGSVYKQDNKLAEAADTLRHAIALLPNQPGPHITLASVLADQGQKQEAAAERKQAAELTRVAVNRQRATFATNTGNMLLAKGQVADAIDRYQEAVASDPGYADAHTGLAAALARQGRTAEAAAERAKAAALERPVQ
ncbi:MAG TPA: tetratricopeptide repeat protein [Acidobacteriaceae bacterium]